MTFDAKPIRCAFQICCVCLLIVLTETSSRSERIPGEQRLYRDLLANYDSAVRPVHNVSSVVNISVRITLNQIVDLDERTQVLTTNVFIDQRWQDENMVWNTTSYNGIKTLRVPASNVWLPDTFIFNNADDASAGFVHSVYVLVTHNGSVLWPVPVKLLSSCKVDITYFPFDDQMCELRFGSWIYSADWVDFDSTVDSFDLSNYIDNSEWKLLAVNFQKTGGTDGDSRPVLTYALHMSRRTFYYIFNIIVPCVMLSVLTLLTFWLPPTSGEKVSLGLSVFLAFSMFMLLIAEEVPATSESVPLIGIYLTTVMTMTSLSVIMAVMVINLYNRGSQARHPHWLLRKLVLVWLSKVLRMSYDIQRLANAINFGDDEMERYRCPVHHHNVLFNSCPVPSNRSSRSRQRQFSNFGRPVELPSVYSTYRDETSLAARYRGSEQLVRRCSQRQNVRTTKQTARIDAVAAAITDSCRTASVDGNGEEPVWLPRGTFTERTGRENSDGAQTQRVFPESPSHCSDGRPGETSSSSAAAGPAAALTTPSCDDATIEACRKRKALARRKLIVSEWQTIATVIDQLLFWIFLTATILAYLIIIIIAPYTKPALPDHFTPLNQLTPSR